MNLQAQIEAKAKAIESVEKAINPVIAPTIHTTPTPHATDIGHHVPTVPTTPSYRNIRTTRIFTSKGAELKTKNGLFYPVTEEEKKLCLEYAAMGYLVEVK